MICRRVPLPLFLSTLNLLLLCYGPHSPGHTHTHAHTYTSTHTSTHTYLLLILTSTDKSGATLVFTLRATTNPSPPPTTISTSAKNESSKIATTDPINTNAQTNHTYPTPTQTNTYTPHITHSTTYTKTKIPPHYHHNHHRKHHHNHHRHHNHHLHTNSTPLCTPGPPPPLSWSIISAAIGLSVLLFVMVALGVAYVLRSVKNKSKLTPAIDTDTGEENTVCARVCVSVGRWLCA